MEQINTQDQKEARAAQIWEVSHWTYSGHKAQGEGKENDSLGGHVRTVLLSVLRTR